MHTMYNYGLGDQIICQRIYNASFIVTVLLWYKQNHIHALLKVMASLHAINTNSLDFYHSYVAS